MLFDAVRILKKSGLQFSLDIFGVRDMAVRSLASMKGVVDVVNFHQEIPQKNLAEHLRRSDLLILCSRYETFGCVVIEANACGVPAVVPDIPVMHELIRGDMNGVFVKPESAAALAEAVINIRNTNKPFNQKEMVATASRYSYHSVGQMFFDEYTSFVNDDEGT
jgi:glycosyltransferase involved in cell wall biosynthesis